MKRKRTPAGPVRRSRRLLGERPDVIWMPNQFQPSSSRLLGLPGEIRDKIWKMVLGNQTIHYWDGRCYRCTDDHSETEAYQMATAENPDKEYWGVDSKHNEKWAALTNDVLCNRHVDCEDGQRLDLQLLQVCKQILAEARHIPYATNEFHFNEPYFFRRFLRKLTSTQLQAVRTIALDVEWTDVYDYEEFEDNWSTDDEFRPTIGEWNDCIDPPLVAQLTGLRTLHLQFNEQFSSLVSFLKVAIDGGWAAESILYFSRLPLETVNVIVTVSNAPDMVEEDEEIQTLPLGGRKNVAKKIQEFLLREGPGKVEEMLTILSKNPETNQEAWAFFRNVVQRETFESWERSGELDD